MSEYSESDVKELCKNISDTIDRSEDLENSLDPLFLVCCGPTDCNPISKILNSEELLLLILKVDTCSKLLKNNAALCVKILKKLFILSRQKDWKIIIKLIKIVIVSDFQDKNVFLEDVWDKKELYIVPAELVLILVNHKSILLEKMLSNLYLTREEHTEIWKSVTYQYWIRWCTQESELFVKVISILNQLVIHVKDKSAILKIVSDFISNVMAECEKNKRIFFSLYPLEFQSFVASLILEPDINPNKKEIIKKFKSMRTNNTIYMLMFLSHFPIWLDLVNI